ncbi:MAG: efflux transporter outer membrane subunit [Phycisphaeraceae bacterium]
MINSVLKSSLIGAALLVGGCSLAPKYVRPASPIPGNFPSGPAYSQVPANADAPTAADLPWQQFFTDEKLQKVIAITLANNRDLRVAALNVERARAMYGVRRADLLPSVSANGSRIRQHQTAELSGVGHGTTSNQYRVDVGIASWELDFFGRIRSLSDAALEEFFATQQARRGSQIMLISETAGVYLTLAADKENLKLSQDTLTAQRNSYDLVKRRLDRGLVPELDLYRVQAQVDTARRAVAQFTQFVAQDQNALNLLAGTQVPADLLPDDLSRVRPPRDIEPGISSAVLLDRPDIAEAEHRLLAANANIGAARAAFFPRISLTAAAGTASSDLSGLFKAGSGVWSYGPQIVLPIFDPRTWSAVKVSNAERDIAVAQYEQAIQVSFRDVADALAVRGTVGEQVTAQQSLVHAVSETYRLSLTRYDKGIDSYLDVLDAQRSLFAAQQDLISLNRTQMTNQVQLYAVLGGGWQNPQMNDPAPEIPAAETPAVPATPAATEHQN